MRNVVNRLGGIQHKHLLQYKFVLVRRHRGNVTSFALLHYMSVIHRMDTRGNCREGTDDGVQCTQNVQIYYQIKLEFRSCLFLIKTHSSYRNPFFKMFTELKKYRCNLRIFQWFQNNLHTSSLSYWQGERE